MNNNLITRNYVTKFETRAIEDKPGLVIGRPIVYESSTCIGGMFNEIIERGALDRTDLTDVLFFINHDTSKIPLARSRRNNGNSSMTLKIDENGLLIETILDIENNTEARNLYSAICRGDIDGMSFMFSINDEEWEGLESDMPTRHIKSISKVVEVSAVNFPAYSDTSINTRDNIAVDTAKTILDNIRKSQIVDTIKDKDKEELELLRLRTQVLLSI